LAIGEWHSVLASMVRLEQPWWLLPGLAAWIPLAAARWGRRRGRQTPAINTALQCLAVALAAASLARPVAPLGRRARPYLILRDVSGSCRGQLDADVPLPDELPRERFDFAGIVTDRGRANDPTRTRLAPALHVALARRGELAGLIVRSDGRFMDAEWIAPAARLGRDALPVFVLPCDSPPPDGRIGELTATRAADGSVRLLVAVEANALQRRALTIRRTAPGAAAELLERRLDLLPGRPASLRLTDTPPPDRSAVYVAALSPDANDPFGENDRAEAVVLPARQRGAVVGVGAAGAAALADELRLPVARLEAATAPRSAAGWMDYAAVILLDPTGVLLPLDARAALAEFVRAGGGLVLVGAGPHASPADRSDPLNTVAPLLADPYQRRPLQLVVALDASGSMAEPADPAEPGRVKFDQALEAVVSLRRHLTAADALTVITFSDAARRVYHSGAEAIDFAALREALGRVRPAGRTDVAKALQQATTMPAAAERDRLVVVVSDLMTSRFRPDRVAEEFRRQKLSLAVVAVGPGGAAEAASPLETLARLLSAPVVRRQDLSGLAEVFAGFLRRRRGDALRRGRFGAALLRPALGRPAGPLPGVGAYLLCAAQPKADVLARVGDEGDPLLAVRRVGLARSVGLALHPAAAENPNWQNGRALTGLTAAAARFVLRPAGDPRFSGHVRHDAAGLLIRLDAADANGPINLLELTGRIASPDANSADSTFPLVQSAPGRYEARLDAPPSPAWLEVALPEGRAAWTTTLARTAPPELRAIGAHWDNLRRLAELTGGRIVHAAELADLGRRLARNRQTDLWPVLLAAAVAIMLAEWAAAKILHRAG